MRAWYPQDLPAALEALEDHPGAVALGGGTDLMVDVNAGRRSVDGVVSLRRVAELRVLDRDRIGAAVRWRQLATAADPALAQAARSVGSPQIRAVGTLGGNLATASPAGDGLVVLAALDAQVEVASPTIGRRLVPWSELLVGPKRTALAADELITAVVLPADRPTRSEFAKVGRRGAMTIAVVNACVALRPDGRVTIALGAVGPTVIRARAAEALAESFGGYSPSMDRELVDAVRSEIRPITDHRSTAEYRRHAAGILVVRLLSRLGQP